MKPILCLALLCYVFAGCSAWQDKTVKESVSVVTESKQEYKGNTSVDYPAPTKQDVNVTASGNATVSVTMPEQEAGTVNLQQEKSGEIESDTSFSFDSYIRSVSLGGWVALVLSFCLLGVIVIYFLRRTMIGKATDAGVSSAMGLLQRSLQEATEKVANGDPNSPEWRIFNELRMKQQQELAELMLRKR